MKKIEQLFIFTPGQTLLYIEIESEIRMYYAYI